MMSHSTTVLCGCSGSIRKTLITYDCSYRTHKKQASLLFFLNRPACRILYWTKSFRSASTPLWLLSLFPADIGAVWHRQTWACCNSPAQWYHTSALPERYKGYWPSSRCVPEHTPWSVHRLPVLFCWDIAKRLRHRPLTPATVGLNPTIPAMIRYSRGLRGQPAKLLFRRFKSDPYLHKVATIRIF